MLSMITQHWEGNGLVWPGDLLWRGKEKYYLRTHYISDVNTCGHQLNLKRMFISITPLHSRPFPLYTVHYWNLIVLIVELDHVYIKTMSRFSQLRHIYCQKSVYRVLMSFNHIHYLMRLHPQCFHNTTLPVSPKIPLQWRHNEHDGGWNHQPYDCLFNHLFGRRRKKTSKLRVTGLCEGYSPVTGDFPAQRANNAENVSIWLRRHVLSKIEPSGLTVLDRITVWSAI